MQIQQVLQRTAIGQKKYRKPYFLQKIPGYGTWEIWNTETHTPSDTLYDENGNAIDPSEIKKGDFLQVEGDGIMLNSYPGQYPGISRIMRISGGTEADAEKFDEELSQILPEKDPSEIPFLNLCYTQPNAQVTAMATQGGYT